MAVVVVVVVVVAVVTVVVAVVVEVVMVVDYLRKNPRKSFHHNVESVSSS